MAKLLKLRRGTTSQHSSFTGAEGEVTVDTDKEALVVHNGSTAGGFPVARADGTGITNFTITGELDAATLDISGNADIDGTLEADAYTVNGTALDTHIAGVTVTNATNAAHVSVADNESTNENNLIPFIEDASSTGNVGLESDGDFHYNPSTGLVSVPAVTTTGNVTVGGNLQVDGTTTTVNSSTMTVTDKNIEIAKGAANDAAADGAGITIDSGDGDKTWNWVDATDAWTSSEHIHLGDNKKLLLGTGSDLSIYHNGTNNAISTDNGQIQINKGTSETIAKFIPDGACELYHDNVLKLQTQSYGVRADGLIAQQGLREQVKVTAGKLSDNTNINLEDGMVHYFTTAETTTCTPNIRFNGSASVENFLGTGAAITVTVVTTAAAAGYAANWTVDGNAVTEKWVGGSAPTAGNASGLDIYTLTIIKTASNTYTVIANLTNAA